MLRRIMSSFALPAMIVAVSVNVAAAGTQCDDTLKASFKADTLTKVQLIRAFKKGETIRTEKSIAPSDVCLVKIGPEKNLGDVNRKASSLA